MFSERDKSTACKVLIFMSLHDFQMFLQSHFLFETQKGNAFQIVAISLNNLILNSSCACTDQNMAHQTIEPSALQMEFPQRLGFLLKNYLLTVRFSGLPLGLHLFDFRFHRSFSLLPILNFSHFFIKRVVQLGYVSLCTVNVCLVIGLKF